MTLHERRRPRTLVVASLALAALMAGCGGGTTAGANTPAAAVESFYHALGDKDADTACAVVSTGGKPLAGVALQQCELGFEKVLSGLSDANDVPGLKRATVTGARVEGDRATVTQAQVTGLPSGFDNDIDLVRIGGRWFIDSKNDAQDDGTGSTGGGDPTPTST